MRSKFVLILVAVLIIPALTVSAGGAAEEEIDEAAIEAYPDDTIELIVPWGAGGRTDVIARLFASVAPDYLGEAMVVVNMAGAGSVIGGEHVFSATPDGYTLLAITPGTNVFPPIFDDGVPYGPDDFEPIGQLSSSTMVVVANPDRGWDGIEDIISYAEENPGEVMYSSTPAAAPRLAFLRWADQAGLEFEHVPAGDDGEAVEQALGGHVDLAVSSGTGPVLSHVQAGSIDAVMVFSDERSSSLPDTPTAKEIGFDVVSSPFTGIAAPPGTPEPILETLREAFAQIVEDETFINLMSDSGEPVRPIVGAAFGGIWLRDYEAYSEVVERMGLER